MKNPQKKQKCGMSENGGLTTLHINNIKITSMQLRKKEAAKNKSKKNTEKTTEKGGAENNRKK